MTEISHFTEAAERMVKVDQKQITFCSNDKSGLNSPNGFLGSSFGGGAPA